MKGVGSLFWMDIFWLDKRLEDSDDRPDPDFIAQEIVEDLEATL